VSTFTRTTFVFTVLSEDPIPETMLMEDVIRECDDGAYVMSPPAGVTKTDTLTPKEMAAALIAAGSDPGFFMLDLPETTVHVVAFRHKTPGEGVGGIEWDLDPDEVRRRVTTLLNGDPGYETLERTYTVEYTEAEIRQHEETREAITDELDARAWEEWDHYPDTKEDTNADR
jgi:hypothetical protein